MKKLLTKNTTKKIFIVIIIMILFNFIVPSYSHADWGGALFDPLIDLMAAVGDAVMAALQYFMYDGNVSLKGQSFFQLTVPNRIFSAKAFDMEPGNVDPGQIYKIYEGDLAETSWWQTINNDGAWAGYSTFFTTWNLGEAFKVMVTENMIADSPYGIPIIRYSPEEIFANEVRH